MKAEFRTLDGAIAVRDVPEPPPPRMIIPCWIPIGVDNPFGNHTTTREYELVGDKTSPCNEFYREVAHPEPAPAHAAEIDRLANRIRDAVDKGGEWPGDSLELARALDDLRSLKKRYFAHTATHDKLQDALNKERANHVTALEEAYSLKEKVRTERQSRENAEARERDAHRTIAALRKERDLAIADKMLNRTHTLYCGGCASRDTTISALRAECKENERRADDEHRRAESLARRINDAVSTLED